MNLLVAAGWVRVTAGAADVAVATFPTELAVTPKTIRGILLESCCQVVGVVSLQSSQDCFLGLSGNVFKVWSRVWQFWHQLSVLSA